MKKVIFILVSIVTWLACEDDAEPIIAPEGVVSEFTDSRDGKIYKCVTIGDQTWMAENLAYRLPLGGLDGCYTYREAVVDTNRIQPVQEDFYAEVKKAIEDGRISNEPLPEFPAFTPVKLVQMYMDYGSKPSEFVAMLKGALNYYPSMGATVEIIEGILEGMKSGAIMEAAEFALEKAEKLNGGYFSECGFLYTYEGALKACPEGWRLPTDEDWKKLEKVLCMQENELELLEVWRGTETGKLLYDEKTGFNVVYSGARVYGRFNLDSPYMNRGMSAYYWSASQTVQNDSIQLAIIRTISRVNNGVLRGTSNMTAAYSVRCIKE